MPKLIHTVRGVGYEMRSQRRGGSMTAAAASDLSAPQTERAFVSDLFHAISQPLTVLECGLEVSLRRDKTAAQFRDRGSQPPWLQRNSCISGSWRPERYRMPPSLATRRRPVAIAGLLLQLREDLLPVAKSAKIKLAVRCESAMVRGNEARLSETGSFTSSSFCCTTCPARHSANICARRVDHHFHE